MATQERVQVIFKRAVQVGISWYPEGSVAAFGRNVAEQLIAQGVAQGVVEKQITSMPKAQAEHRQIVSEPGTPQSENKMVTANERPTIGTRVRSK